MHSKRSAETFRRRKRSRTGTDTTAVITLRFCLLNAKLWRSSLGTYQAHSTNRPAPKLKSVGVQPFGFGKGWSLPQERNSASSKEKFAHIKRNKANSHNTERTKPQIKKAACRKETAEPLSHTANQRTKEHQTCMRRIDRKQPTVGRQCIGQPPTGGGRSLDCRYPQNKGISLGLRVCLNFGALWVLCSADIG